METCMKYLCLRILYVVLVMFPLLFTGVTLANPTIALPNQCTGSQHLHEIDTESLDNLSTGYLCEYGMAHNYALSCKEKMYRLDGEKGKEIKDYDIYL